MENHMQDSKTSDVKRFVRIPESRVRLTIRINKGLKEALKRHCKTKGLSICHIAEALLTAYLLGWNQKLDLDVKSPTIDLTVVRDVKRVRRYAVERVVGDGRCVFCGRKSTGLFEYLKTGERYPLCGFHVKEFVNGLNWDVVRDGR